MRILIVKLSSMGDLIQALPALSDAHSMLPDAQFDWVVDENFAEIPAWHPAIHAVYTTAHRRWRKELTSARTRREVFALYRTLRSNYYDCVIDAQANLKSALVSWISRGVKHGLDHTSVRERGAQLAYKYKYSVDKQQLAIERWRTLFAQALGYSRPSNAYDFGIGKIAFPNQIYKVQTRNYLLFVHNASWPNKLWPLDHWRKLVQLASSAGYKILLPWGNKVEQEQAELIAKNQANCEVLPHLNLSTLAHLFQNSRGALCMDTGLAHLSAALGMPTITMYGPTNANLIGATGLNSTHLSSDNFDCAPCYKKICNHQGTRQTQAQCLSALTPDLVWKRFLAGLRP